MSNLTNVTTWLYGLLAAFIGSAASAASIRLASAILDEPISWKLIGMSCLVAGVASAAAYLKQSPLPKLGEEGYNYNEGRGDV